MPPLAATGDGTPVCEKFPAFVPDKKIELILAGLPPSLVTVIGWAFED